MNIRICPKCGKEYTEPPALSRADNSEICSDCGIREALEAIPDECMDPARKAEILKACTSARKNIRPKSHFERTREQVYASGNKWAIENFEATHS